MFMKTNAKLLYAECKPNLGVDSVKIRNGPYGIWDWFNIPTHSFLYVLHIMHKTNIIFLYALIIIVWHSRAVNERTRPVVNELQMLISACGQDVNVAKCEGQAVLEENGMSGILSAVEQINNKLLAAAPSMNDPFLQWVKYVSVSTDPTCQNSTINIAVLLPTWKYFIKCYGGQICTFIQRLNFTASLCRVYFRF